MQNHFFQEMYYSKCYSCEPDSFLFQEVTN